LLSQLCVQQKDVSHEQLRQKSLFNDSKCVSSFPCAGNFQRTIPKFSNHKSASGAVKKFTGEVRSINNVTRSQKLERLARFFLGYGKGSTDEVLNPRQSSVTGSGISFAQ
jgi:hypothetical protein